MASFMIASVYPQPADMPRRAWDNEVGIVKTGSSNPPVAFARAASSGRQKSATGGSALKTALKMPTTTNRGRAYIRRCQTIHGRPSAGALKRQRRRWKQDRNARSIPQGGNRRLVRYFPNHWPPRGGRGGNRLRRRRGLLGRRPAWRACRTGRSARKRWQPPSRSMRRWLPKDRQLTANSYPTPPAPDRELISRKKRTEK